MSWGFDDDPWEWDAEWNEKSIVVYHILTGEWMFFKDRSDLHSMEMMTPELEDMEDTNKKKLVTYEDLYEMWDLAKLIKERKYNTTSQLQTQIDDFVIKSV